MEVKQVAQFVNTAVETAIGKANYVAEDLSNIVSVGKEILDAGDNVFDNYVGSLYNVVGKQVFEDRVYRGPVVSVMRDKWEYGSMRMKIRMDIPEAVDNPAWQLVDGQTYNQDKFYAPKIHQAIWNDSDTFMIPLSFCEEQIKESLLGPQQANAFVSMLYNGIDNGITKRAAELIRRAINNMIAVTIKDDYGTDILSSKSGIKAVNLLYLYNQTVSTPITAANALYDPDFLRFAAVTIRDYVGRLRDMSTLFNVKGTVKFTPAELQHVVLLQRFESAVGGYLYNAQGQFLVDNIKLPYAETVNYWQGTGTDYSFNSISGINVVNTNGDSVQATGIVGVIFDHDAIGVCNEDTKVNVHRNEIAEFTSNFAKVKLSLLNAFDEQFVVFFIA